jgi:hypothetical protein
MQDDGFQMDIFEQKSVKSPLKQMKPQESVKSKAQIVCLTNLGDCIFKPRPYTVVRINPTTVYILNK